MKKQFLLWGGVALLALASCQKEAENGKQPLPETSKGDMFMTMNITQSSSNDTRTDTPNQGIEIGQNYENKVTHALVIFARPSDNTIFKAIHVGEQDITGSESPYAATFEMSRQDLIKDIDDNGEDVSDDKKISYNVFVVANPTDGILDFYLGAEGIPAATKVQSIFTLDEDAETYWTSDYFLMSNSELAAKEIKKSQIPEGTHTTVGSALNLGSVKIQRAMSRFDLETSSDNQVFTAQTDKNPLKDITITFDAVALVNQAKTAHLFKVTTENEDGQDGLQAEYDGLTSGMSIKFNPEKVGNYVFSPIQTGYTLPLFDGVGNAATGVQGGNPVAFTSLTYTLWSTIHSGTPDNSYTHPTNQTPENEGAYKIWRYCMENTNYDKDNQFHGNSTGIVLRAVMTSSTIKDDENVALYAFNNIIIGKAATLRDYAVNNKSNSDDTGIYDLVNIRYKAAVAAYNGDPEKTNNPKFTYEVDKNGTDGWTAPEGSELAQGYIDIRKATDEQLAGLDEYLVEKEFAIYRPTPVTVNQDGAGSTTKYVYYCYYTYWNRHNDNRRNTLMGPMEFATVRNNVYKIKVNTVNRLGHPGDPDDDPDPEDPGTPDEEDHLYLSVQCEILPWEVRMNGLDL